MFYQHVRLAALNQQQETHVTVFTTELFAHYLHIKCLSVTKCQQLSDTTSFLASTYEEQSYAKYIAKIQQLFIADALAWRLINTFSANKCVCNQHSGRNQNRSKFSSKQKLVNTFPGSRCVYKQHSSRNHNQSKFLCKQNTSDLVELLQKFAIAHLTAFRQIDARDFGSTVTIVTSDFVSLYAYKRGDYQQCLQLSTQNVRTLLYADKMYDVPTYPEFVQLMDYDIVSLTALILIVNPTCRQEFDIHSRFVLITQMTLSLYLKTQCQLKLRHSVTSLAQTLDYIKFAHRRHPVDRTLDRLVLKMTAHKALIYITTMMK